ncbi:DUF5785 family protein [Halovenus rubra]|uniref:DUF5785 family protein n=2 Tax=Halovenus rubra TaxID=869890 RepID=A0ACC7E385_9EURY|nr:DUF5785 family protein [Halovenus rubra]
MDWPHDPDGDKGSEGRRKYGHAVLAKKVDEEEDFPFTASEYVEQYGDHPVRIDYDRVVSVEDIFDEIDESTEFEDFPDFHRVLGSALRDKDYWPYRLESA